MNIIDLETPLNTEKYFAPKTDDIYPFYITEYGKTFRNTPCYQLRMNSTIACAQYVISGSGIIICNDTLYSVCEGDSFLLPEGSNQIYYSNPDNQFERIWINFRGELARALLKIYKLEDTVVFKSANTQFLFEEIFETCKEAQTPEDYKNRTSRLFLKLVQFLAENKGVNSDAPGGTIEQIRPYIDCRITENITISDIATHFSFSSEHLIRLFKKTYGITPHQYIIRSKIRLAMIMLKTTDLHIAEISDKLNFPDSHCFSAMFKRIMGYSPTEYRKK